MFKNYVLIDRTGQTTNMIICPIQMFEPGMKLV